MKNLKNYTKAELISKLNNVKQNNNNNKDSIFTIFMTLLLTIKSFLIKITLIALIIKIFRKYSILRKIFTIINTILFSIFGFSLIDIYEIEFLSKFFNNIINVFSKFHENILEIFGKKVELPSKSESMRRIPKETIGIQTSNESNNKIIERFTKIIHKEEVKPEVIQDDTPYYKNKYIIIAGLLILSGITWYFYDDIRPIGSSILAWINILKSKPDNDPGDNDGNVQVNKSLDLTNRLNKLKDSVKEKIYGKPKEDNINSTSNSSIKLGESSKSKIENEMDHYFPESSKGKAVDLNNLSQAELERRGLIEPELTGLKTITGKSEEFGKEGGMILKELQTFTNYFNEDKFPDTKLEKVSYNLLSKRLTDWSKANPDKYKEFMINEFNKEIIDTFNELQSDINLIDSPQSDNYEEVENVANQERDVWSDRANTPQQLLSPKFISETAMDTLNKDKPKIIIDNTVQVKDEPITPSDKLKSFWDGLKGKILNKDEDNIEPITIKATDIIPEEEENVFSEVLNIMGPIRVTDNDLDKLVEETSTQAKLLNQELENKSEIKDQTEIIEDNNSTPSEMGNYFTDTKQEVIQENKSDKPKGFTSLFESIRAKRKYHDDSDDLIELTKNTVINFQKAEGLFSKDNILNTEDHLSKEMEVLYSKENIDNSVKERPILAQNLKAIRSKRLDYGSPSVANVGLPRGDLSPLIINQASTSKLPDINEGIDLEDNNQVNDNRDSDNESLTLHDWKKEIKLDIKKGNPYERFIEFDFGEHHKDINRLYIITNDGQSFHVNPHTVNKSKQDIKWDIKGKANTYWRDLDIYSINIFDDKGTQTIYENKNIKFLDNFNDNIGKGFRFYLKMRFQNH